MKSNLLLLIIILLNGCKLKDEVIPNHPPTNFIVTTKLDTDGKTIILNWTKAKDHDNDFVTYTVVLKDTLIKNISDTTFIINDLNFNQVGKVIAKDSKGLTTESNFTASTKTLTFVNIPDANFEKYLVAQKIDRDGIINGQMNLDDTKNVRTIQIPSKNIKSIIGLEAFLDLEFLVCDGNKLTNLDISKNINLKYLFCPTNQLTNINVSKNINLINLICYNNALTNIDVSDNIELKTLSCSSNRLTNIDVSRNINLKSFQCDYNKLTNIDVSKNLSLESLSCSSNRLTNIDVSKNLSLKSLSTSYNRLTNIDISKNLKLQELYCYENLLINLDISKNYKLEYLNSQYNELKTICVADITQANANFNWQKDDSVIYIVCK